MVGEACLPSKAYFPWTPDYTLFIYLIFGGSMFVSLNIPNFAFEYIYYDFSENTILVCLPQSYLFTLPFGVIGRLRSVTLALLGHRLSDFCL